MNSDKSTSSTPPLSSYYKSINLSPVEHDVVDPKQFKLYEKKRKNLFEYYLKIPKRMFQNAQILEFGPGSGENSVIYAKYGAKTTLVEPLDYLLERLKNNFKAHGVSGQIVEDHIGSVEGFKTDKKFDFVMAEGFLQYVKNPYKHLAGFLADEGLLVCLLVHPAGTFIEYFKKIYLMLMIERLGKTGDKEGEFECAEKLFLNDFGGIPHSRGFHSWCYDTVLNPIYRSNSFIDFESALLQLPTNVYLYSSWPNYLNNDELYWHKTLKTQQKVRELCLNGYYSRYSHFIHSTPQGLGNFPLLNPADGRKIARKLEETLEKLDGIIEGKFSSEQDIFKHFDSFRTFLRSFNHQEQNLDLLNNICNLFAEAKNFKKEDEWIKAYQDKKILGKSWGSPGHWWAFKKSDFFEDS